MDVAAMDVDLDAVMVDSGDDADAQLAQFLAAVPDVDVPPDGRPAPQRQPDAEADVLSLAEALRRIQEVLPDVQEAQAKGWLGQQGKTVAKVNEFIANCFEQGYVRKKTAPSKKAPPGQTASEEAKKYDWREEVAARWEDELRNGGEEAAATAASASSAPERSTAYVLHAEHTLRAQFATIPDKDIAKQLEEHKTFTATSAALQKWRGKRDTRKASRKPPRPPNCAVPAGLAQEIANKLNKARIQKALRARRQIREKHVAKLKEIGGLNTCQVCFGDDVPEEETMYCSATSSPHTFCIPCVKMHALTEFGKGLFVQNFYQDARSAAQASASSSSAASSSSSASSASSPGVLRTIVGLLMPGQASSSSSSSAADAIVDVEKQEGGELADESSGQTGRKRIHMSVVCCPAVGGCKGHFTEAALQKALPEKELKRYTSRSAALHAVASGIQGLAPCPGCDFMVEMAENSEHVIRCLNPDCGKVSCRNCGEPDHRPLRCDEVEKDVEVKLRTYLEEQLTEIGARRCPNPKCRKMYEKTEGCNKMSCPCGTSCCFLCGEQIDKANPYNHFKDGSQGGGANCKTSRCVVYGTPAWAKKELSPEATKQKLEEVFQAYIEAHPKTSELGEERLNRIKAHVGLAEKDEEKRPAPPKKKRRG